MKFEEEFTTDNVKEPDKTLISNDTYALCTMVDELIKKLNQLRINSIFRR